MRSISPYDLSLRPFSILDRDWALLVAGTREPNPMTVSWGGFGTLWNLPTVTVYVRPTRFTFGLLEGEPEFTLNVMPPAFKKALELCGTKSGRDTHKWSAAGLRPVPSERVEVPRVEGADLSLECRVVATLALDPARFMDPRIKGFYPEADHHTAFLGEVLTAWVSDGFAAAGPKAEKGSR